MTFNAARGERRVVGFQKYDANDIVSDVTLSLELLRIMFFIRKLRRNVKHNFNRSPICVNRVETGQVVNGVQASFVFVES